MFYFAKCSTFFMLVRFSFLFACVRHNQSGDLAFSTPDVKDTHLTLAVIPFQVGINILLIFSVITNKREKICQVSIPLKSINSLFNFTRFGNYLCMTIAE